MKTFMMIMAMVTTFTFGNTDGMKEVERFTLTDDEAIIQYVSTDEIIEGYEDVRDELIMILENAKDVPGESIELIFNDDTREITFVFY